MVKVIFLQREKTRSTYVVITIYTTNGLQKTRKLGLKRNNPSHGVTSGPKARRREVMILLCIIAHVKKCGEYLYIYIFDGGKKRSQTKAGKGPR